MDKSWLDLIAAAQSRERDPLLLPWASPGNPGAFLSFEQAGEWFQFIEERGLSPGIPDIVVAKYRRAQKLYVLGWIDVDLIKAGELVAFTALELSLVDRYGRKPFAYLLRHMVEADGQTDQKIPLIAKNGGTAIGRLTGEAKPTLAGIRNSLAHGEPFDGLPWGSLLELIRDLVEYAYRDRSQGIEAAS
ncbi:MAG TPA: hypothetical protein VMU41_02645 [Candidatus Binataceae bacterium]|nr:hypothetical protein [Candidatus Binataceae bacterium]